jgi:hypothetical protein
MPDEARENRWEWVEDCPASVEKVVGILYELSSMFTLSPPTGRR